MESRTHSILPGSQYFILNDFFYVYYCYVKCFLPYFKKVDTNKIQSISKLYLGFIAAPIRFFIDIMTMSPLIENKFLIFRQKF